MASPWLLSADAAVAVPLLVVWGIVVAGDSPQFSGIAARSVPPALVGTALTFMNAIGFAITIGSVSLLAALARGGAGVMLIALAPGPVIGCIALLGVARGQADRHGDA